MTDKNNIHYIFVDPDKPRLEEFKCPRCGSTETELRNAYNSRHGEHGFGFGFTRYCCKGCGTPISLLNRIYDSSTQVSKEGDI